MLYDLLMDEQHGLKGIADIIWSYRSKPAQLMRNGTEKEILDFLKNTIRGKYEYNSSKLSYNVMHNRLSAYRNATQYKLEALKAVLSGLCQECGGQRIEKISMVANTQQDFCSKCYLKVYGPFIDIGEFESKTTIDPCERHKAKPPRYWSNIMCEDGITWRCREVDIDKIVKYHTNKLKKLKKRKIE